MLRRYYGKIGRLPLDQFKGHDGELVIDDETGRVYVMDGVTFGGKELVGAFPKVSENPPENPGPGELWFDPVIGRTYIYYQDTWVDSSPNSTYSLPVAGEDVLGGIRVGNNLYIDEEGRLSAEDGNYTLPAATDTTLGGVKVGTGISVAEDGTISVDLSNFATETYVDNKFGNWQFFNNNLINNGAGDAVIQASDFAGAGVTLTTGASPNYNHWYFRQDGNLSLPEGGFINYSNGTSILEGIVGVSNYTLPVATGSVLGGIKLGEGFSTDDQDRVTTNKLYSTNQTQPNQHYRLELDTNGVVHLPDQSIINGATLKSVPGNYAGITAGPQGADEDSWVWVDGDGAWVGTKYNTDQKLWHFNNDGELVFPDNSTQTTAYTGPVQTYVGASPPLTPSEGTMWFDTTDGRTYISLDNVWVDAAPGYKGDKGDQGEPGAKGDKGDPGEMGPPSVYMGGNLIPNANVTYSLGSSEFQWKDLWVSNSTIYIGGTPLSIDNTGNLLVNGNAITAGSTYNDANVAAYLEQNPQTGTYSDSNVAAYLVSNPPTGTYNNSNVAAYLPTYSGTVAGTRIQATNSHDLMWTNFTGTYPYWGWQITDADTLKLRTNVSSGDFTNDVISVDRTTQTVTFIKKAVVSDTTNSISTSTGALTVTGGLGVARDVHIGGTLTVTDTTPSTSYDTGALVINGGLGVNGNINLSGNINILEGNINIVEFTGATGNFYGDPVTGFGAMYAGKSGFTALPYTVAQISTNSNSYSQVNIENINSGKLASADYIGTGDIGTDASWFFDLGIAGSGYDPVLAAQNNAPGTSVGPLDVYLYVQGNTEVPDTGGNLTIGTSQDTKVVKFIAGGYNAENIVLTLSQDNVTAARDLFAPNVYAGGYFYSNGTPIIAADGSFSITTINSTTVNAQTINTQIVNGNGATMTGLIYNPDIANISANVSALQASAYSNANVASYLVANPPAGTYSNSNVASYLVANPQSGTYSNSNVASYLVANPQAGTYSNSNVASYLLGSISVGNVSSTNGYHWANGAPYAGTYANANVASYLAANPPAGSYSNSNVAGYLAGSISVGNINLGSAMRLNGTTNTIDTSNGGSITFGSRLNLTGSAAGYGLVVNNPAQFAGNILAQGTGGISIPNRPAFRIYGANSTNWTTPNNFKGGNIVVDYNQGSYFNSSTGIFTAPVTGLYEIHLNARVGNNNGSNQIMVIKNGLTSAGNVAVMWECDTNTGTATHFGVGTVMKLAAGDILTANVTVGTVQFDANDSWSVTFIG